MASPGTTPYKTEDMVLATCLVIAGLPLTYELREGRQGSAWFVFPNCENVLLQKAVTEHALRKLRVEPVKFHETFAKVRRELMEWLTEQGV